MDDDAALTDQLAPLADELMRVAHERAAGILTEARISAEAISGDASEEASVLVADAADQARRKVELESARELARARREALRTVLAAKQELYEAASERAMDRAIRLRAGDSYPELEDRLVAIATRLLGPDADIERDPGGNGGVLAACGHRVLDLTLPTLAKRCFDRLGPAIESLMS